MLKDVKKLRSHYVPQAFLKGFIDEQLFVYNRQYKTYRTSSQKGVAYQLDFYIVDTVTEKDSLEVEQGLGKIESVVIPLLGKLSSTKQLKNSEWADIAIYVAIQYGRTPTARKTLDDVYTVMISNAVKENLADTLNTPGCYDSLKRDFEAEHTDIKLPSREKLGEMILKPGPIANMSIDNGTFVKAFFEVSEKISSGLLKRRWKLLQAPKDSLFITSDNPIALLARKPLTPNQKPAILVEGIEIYMPIDSKHCLAIADMKNDGSFLKHKITKSQVRAINKLVFSQANKYVISGNKALLESLEEA